MTREEIEKLEVERLNAAVAEHVEGWKWMRREEGDAIWLFPPETPDPIDAGWCGIFRRCEAPDAPAGERYHGSFPHYSTAITAAQRMEDAIAKGTEQLRHAYTVMLSQIVMGIVGCQDWRDSWAVIRATPEQRCRAALLAVSATPATAAGRGEG